MPCTARSLEGQSHYGGLPKRPWRHNTELADAMTRQVIDKVMCNIILYNIGVADAINIRGAAIYVSISGFGFPMEHEPEDHVPLGNFKSANHSLDTVHSGAESCRRMSVALRGSHITGGVS